jgi:hypothetical protein
MDDPTQQLTLVQISNPTAFLLFGSLPEEMRLKILGEALPDAQVIVVKSSGSMACDPPQIELSHGFPGVFHVCREAARSYTYSFEEQLSGKGVWFNYERDALFFECETVFANFMGHFPVEGAGLPPKWSPGYLEGIAALLDNLQYLAIGSGPHRYWLCRKDILAFRGLNVLVLENIYQEQRMGQQKQVTEVEKWEMERKQRDEITQITTKHPTILWFEGEELRSMVRRHSL